MTRCPSERSSAALEFSASNCARAMLETRGGIRTGIKHLVSSEGSYTDQVGANLLSLSGGPLRPAGVPRLNHTQHRGAESLDVGEIHFQDPQQNCRIQPRVIVDEDVAESHHAPERP